MKTTEERMKRILELRSNILGGQKVHSELSEKLAPARAELDIALAKLQDAYVLANADDLDKLDAAKELCEEAEKEIRSLVVEEYESRGVVERKDKQVAPDLGVQVREVRTIEGEHAAILEDVKENYPTLLTYDDKKLIKQSQIYDVLEEDVLVDDETAEHPEGGKVQKSTVQYAIKEMPYIRITRNATAVIKKGFWEVSE